MSSSSSSSLRLLALLTFSSTLLVSAQDAPCYWAAGPQYRLPPSAGVVPCSNNGYSTCCKLGDSCLGGNACFNYLTGNTYQYGCSDPTYKDPSCPYKCGFNPDLSPWVGIQYVPSYEGYEDTWACTSPESCLCEWRSTFDLLLLPIVPVQSMGSLARVAVYASTYPNNLPPYAALPATAGGTTGYYKSASTPAASYTPSTPVVEPSLKVAEGPILYNPGATPVSRTYAPATYSDGSLPPYPTTPTNTAPTSDVLGGTTTVSYSSRPSSSSSGGSTGTSSSSTTTSTGSSGGGGGGSSSSGLTTGAKVGLGVGIAGGVCLLAAIVLVTMVLRRRKAKRIEAATVYNDKKSDDVAAYYDPYNRGANVHEAQYTPQDEATARKRMSPNGFIAELDSGQPIHEMDSTTNSAHPSPAVGASSLRLP